MKLKIRPVRMLLLLGAVTSFVHAADYSSWKSYRPVTLSTAGMGLSQPVKNIPLSIRFKASAHGDMLNNATTQVQANGSDIRVTKADGTTDVPFEIEYLKTGADGALHLWVLADSVGQNSTNAASFRVYWGKTGETSKSNGAAVFPASAGYQAVFHLNDTTSTIVNSANNALNGTAIGTSTTTGQSAGNGFVSAKSGVNVRAFGSSAGGEDNSAPVENYIKFTPGNGHPLRNSGPLTIEAWIYSSITNNGNTSPGTKHIVAQGSGGASGKAWFARTAALDGGSEQNHYSAGGPNNNEGPIAPFGEQHHWHFVTAVWDGTHWTIYRNRESDFWNNPTVAGPEGMSPDSALYRRIAGTAPVASSSPWYLGAASTDNGDSTVMGGWHGWMDEVRISTVARDSNYVKLNFLTTRGDSLGTHPLSIGSTETPSITGPYANWTGHRTITLNTTSSGANIPANVTNFPVLIRLGENEANILSEAKANGEDIRFSKMDNATALPYEIESWSATSAAIWVKVDTVYGNNNNQGIRIHWGNSAATSESNGADVFPTANGYRAVFHMSQPGETDIVDATANAIVGTNVGTASTPGLIGAARKFAGTNAANTNTTNDRQYINVGNPAGLDFQGRITMSAWVRWTHVAGTENESYYRTFINRDGTDPSAEVFLRIGQNSGGPEYAQYTTGKYAPPDIIAQSPQMAHEYPDSAVWTHVAGVYDSVGPTQRLWRLYRNGVQIAVSEDAANAGVTGSPTLWRIGRGPGTQNARWFVGDMDEVRIDNATRDSNYIKLSYENQKELNSLTNIGNPNFTPPKAPTGVTATADTARVLVSWTAPTDNGGRPILDYKVMVVGDTLQSCTSTGLSCTVTGLLSTQSYSFVVRARNIIGVGPNSSPSTAVTPKAPIVPTAPRTPTATTVNASTVTVAWTAPAYNGGSAITGYTVTAAPGGMTCMTAGELTCQVTGLTQGTRYAFTVVATNVAGNSPASDSAIATTTSLLPGAFVIAMDGSRNPYTYRLPASLAASTERLSMTITNVQGKRVWSQTVTPASGRTSEITWNGVTSKGQPVAPGLYIVKISAVMNGESIDAIRKSVKQ